MLPDAQDLVVSTLGPGRFRSPLVKQGRRFADEAGRVLTSSDARDLQAAVAAGREPAGFEPAGPRPKIYFDPRALVCGIVTCGGLCPGINNVIRSVVRSLHYAFGVKTVLGFRYGFAGLAANAGQPPVPLTPEAVDRIHETGGTMLGTSRGAQDLGAMVDTLVRRKVGILFAIGGDGTHRAIARLHREIERRGLRIAVVGVPKTIDNDIPWIERTFGFATAVEAAQHSLVAAHAEARAAWNGVGLVKLMGRESGFIAAHASLANADVNFCLVPEVPFRLAGEGGFLAVLERRLAAKHHAVVVVAEGAGQELIDAHGHPRRDASGNPKLKDVGLFLKDRIERHFARRRTAVTIKYIDPSYSIRSLPANALDAEFCLTLGQHAVHAGMAGRTDMMVGYWNQRFTHVPSALATSARRRLDPQGEVWQRVLEATGQAAAMVG